MKKFLNYEFNLEEWIPRFPLTEKRGHYSGGDITSPCDICNIEQLRRAMADEYHWGKGVPVDIFVMSKGEPANRAATKIGGLPYRSADEPWPCSSSGQPLALIAQFNFSNSKDIVGELPGDLLLLFSDNSEGIFDPLHFEWQDFGLTDLVQPEQLPDDRMFIEPCYGNRCRMLSYPFAVEKSVSGNPKCHGKDVSQPYLIPRFQATQIGRAPYFIQEDDETLPGVPLCTIASVQPDMHQPYPWVNVPEPVCEEGKWNYDGGELMIDDLGCIYIFIDEDGNLHTGSSSY